MAFFYGDIHNSPYQFGEPQLIHSNSSAYYTHDSFLTPSGSNYDYSEPIENHSDSSYNYYEYSGNPSEVINYNPLQYEPPPSDEYYYFPLETKFTISYSTVEFNEPEFEEYDSTPYGGGYDPDKIYGKSLPPSDVICYPRSLPKSDSISLENFSYSSIPSPYGKDNHLPRKPPKLDTKTQPEILIPIPESPPSERGNGFENETRGDYSYEGEGQMSHFPHGSGLETLDLCESLFGHWPCLAKMERDKYREVCDRERRKRRDPWESATNYLFGSPLVYDYDKLLSSSTAGLWKFMAVIS